MMNFGFESTKNQMENLPEISSTRPGTNAKISQKQDTSTSRPQRLSRSVSATVTDIAIDVLLLAVSMAFFVLAIVARRYDGASANENPKVFYMLSEASRLVNLQTSVLNLFNSKQGATILPIMFATIIGRSCKAALLWRLEKGTTIGTLDLLASSTSLSSIVLAQSTLRVFTLLSPALLFIWALSPIGSQASLRLLYLSDSIVPWTFYYIQQDSSLGTSNFSDRVTTIQTAAVLTPQLVKKSPQDLWGNFKTPMIEPLKKNGLPDDKGWYMVPSNATYASLVGTPIGNIPLTNPTSFLMTVETSYWVLDCVEVVPRQGDKISKNSTLLGSEEPCRIPCFSSDVGWQDRFARPPVARNLFYTSWDTDMEESQQTSASQCTIRTTYVQLQVECQNVNTKSACAAKKIRLSQLTTNPVSEFTLLDQTDDFFLYFARAFCDVPIMKGPGLSDIYLIEPDTMDSTNMTPAYELGTDRYSIRFGQLLNSFWGILNGQENIMLGLSSANRFGMTITNSTNGSLIFGSTVIRCNNIWMAFLFIASIVMITGTLSHIILTFILCHAPDSLNGNISSMLRDNPWVYPRAADSMTYNSAHRSAHLAQDAKNLKVMLGDVHEKETVGHLAIGLLGSGYSVAPITKYRSFY